MLIGALSLLGILAIFAIIWVANIHSCFSSPDFSDDAPAPRALHYDDPSERRLATHFADAWQASGRMLDSSSVWILDDSPTNAASLGGGVFVLWKGLERESDETVDVILAHEIAHDELQHSEQMAGVTDVSDFVGEALSTFAGSDENTTRTLKRWSGTFIIPHYSKAQELEADSLAVGLLAARGMPRPAAMVCRAFITLRSSVGEAGGGYFASHPGLSERVTHIRTLYPSPTTSASCR